MKGILMENRKLQVIDKTHTLYRSLNEVIEAILAIDTDNPDTEINETTIEDGRGGQITLSKTLTNGREAVKISTRDRECILYIDELK